MRCGRGLRGAAAQPWSRSAGKQTTPRAFRARVQERARGVPRAGDLPRHRRLRPQGRRHVARRDRAAQAAPEAGHRRALALRPEEALHAGPDLARGDAGGPQARRRGSRDLRAPAVRLAHRLDAHLDDARAARVHVAAREGHALPPGARLRELPEAPRGGAAFARPAGGADARGLEERVDGAAGHASARARDARHLRRHRSEGDLAVDAVRELSRGGRGCRSQASRRGGAARAFRKRASGFRALQALPRVRVPPGSAQEPRRLGPARGREVLRAARAVPDHHDAFPRGDPLDRARGGGAHPRRDGQGDRVDRVHRVVRRLREVHQHRPALLLHQARGPARRLPRHREARGCRASQALRRAAAHALRHPRDGGVRGRQRRPLFGPGDGRQPRGVLRRQREPPSEPAVARDGGDPAPRGRAGPSPSDRALVRAAGPAALPPHRLVRRLRRGVGALRGEPRLRDGLLYRPVHALRRALGRDAARLPAGGGHGAAREGMDPRGRHPLPRRQLGHERGVLHGGDRPLHRVGRAGARLQDRRAQDQGAARPGAGGARGALRPAPLPQRDPRRRRAPAHRARGAHRRMDRGAASRQAHLPGGRS